MWSIQVEESFQKLNVAMCHPPILALPSFSKPFTIECDASGVGLGVFLM